MDRSTRRMLCWGIAFSSTALILGMAAVSRGYRAPAGDEQPKVTDWIQAWGAILGVIAGSAAALVGAWLLLHERRVADEAKRQLSEQRSEQEEARARLVITSGVEVSIESGRITYVRLVLHNFGPEPIHWVATSVILPSGREIIFSGVEFVSPGKAVQLGEAVSPAHPSVGDNPRFERSLVSAQVVFSDSSGLRWRRLNNGSPSREPSELVHLRDLIEHTVI